MSFNGIIGSNNSFNGAVILGDRIHNNKKRKIDISEKCKVIVQIVYDDDEHKDDVHIFRYDDQPGQIHIEVKGDVTTIECANSSVTVHGDIKQSGVRNTNGRIDIGGSVTGNVSTVNGSIKVGGHIEGDASTVNGSIISTRQ